MELDQEQITRISSHILISDILDFISNHQEEYNIFLAQESLTEKEVINSWNFTEDM